MRKSREILLNITGKTDDISDNEKKNQNTPDTNNTDGNKGGKPENDISSSVIKGTNNVSSSAQRVIQRVLERENEYRSEKRKRNIRYGTTDLEMDW